MPRATMVRVNLFHRRPPERIVKAYGRDSFLLWLNPLVAALQATMGLRVGIRSDADVLEKMQKDALEMAKKGYEVRSADQFDLPLMTNRNQKATFYKVTYELVDARRNSPAQDRT